MSLPGGGGGGGCDTLDPCRIVLALDFVCMLSFIPGGGGGILELILLSILGGGGGINDVLLFELESLESPHVIPEDDPPRCLFIGLLPDGGGGGGTLCAILNKD